MSPINDSKNNSGPSRISFTALRFIFQNQESSLHSQTLFQQEDLPLRGLVTGNQTMMGYIPLVNVLTNYGWVFVVVFHVDKSAFRMVTNPGMIFSTWYPFDASVRPLYEDTNVIQVQRRKVRLLYVKQGMISF